jgi:hypothetical protein
MSPCVLRLTMAVYRLANRESWDRADPVALFDSSGLE